MRQTKKQFQIIVALLVLTIAPLFVMRAKSSAAGWIQPRSVLTNTAVPGAVMSETFNFSLASVTPIGSIVFDHCANSPLVTLPCVAPTGYTASAVVLTAQTNNIGFTYDAPDSSANRIVITRPTAAANLGVTTYGFTNITNTSVAGQTVYVRIATYASTNGTGSSVDEGSMAFASQAGFSVGAYVPPFLIFCVGLTVDPSCNASHGSLISFGELSTSVTKTATSQFSGATNDPGGYQVFIDGHTMTAGNQIITALNGGPSVVGASQFGFNLRANSNPSVGADQTGIGTAVISPNYNTPNQFRMSAGDQLTNSPLSSDFNITTVSYIVNISNAQPPGYYATTLAFIATAAF